ncbi:MAG: PHP domain-containing protein [Clostridia bacterium]|nr:PHP domain-containing protein [Clostridia bacterium]
MNKYYYDLHLHSCLSPCGDNEMTPGNIAGMATLCGLNIVALTDHNTAKNCPAFFEAAKRNGIIPVAGMELTTAEDIHVVCLFETLAEAMDFDKAVGERRVLIPNRVEIFGDQLVCDGEDNVIATEEHLLSNATTISLDEALKFTESRGGVCYPAHIDREANGVICTLGTFPDYPPFKCAELHDIEKFDELANQYPALRGKLALECSDAHYLWNMRDKSCYFELEDEPYSSELVRHNLFEILRRGAK